MRGIKEYDPHQVEPILRASIEERAQWEREDEERRARHPQKREPLSLAEKEMARAFLEALFPKRL